MQTEDSFIKIFTFEFGADLDSALVALLHAWQGQACGPAVDQLEAAFEAHYPFSKAYFLEHGNPFGPEELMLRARYFLFRLFARRLRDLGASLEEITALVEEYLKKNDQSNSAYLVLGELYEEAGSWKQASTIVKNIIIKNIVLLLPQQVYLEMLRRKYPDGKTQVSDGFFLGDLSDRFCCIPFDDVELDCLGSAWTCCPSQLPVPIGNFFTTPWAELWPSEKARELRRSILDGDFSYCSRTHCSRILSGALPRRADLAGTRYEPLLAGTGAGLLPPVKVIFGQDASCNLVCPQCRTEPYRIPPEQAARLDRAMVEVVEPILEQAAESPFTIFMAGHGDPFASEHYLGILRRLDPVKHAHVALRLLTNGLLFKQAWPRLENIHPLLRQGCVKVSLDGGSSETYRLTRGASWDKLLENLEFLADLRRRGLVGAIGANLTVQECNFHEMGLVAELAVRLGFDTFEFNGLRNEGTYSVDDFRRRTIFDAAHPRHAEFLEALRHPALRAPILTFGTLTPQFQAATAEG